MLIGIKFFVFVDKKTLNFCVLASVFALFYRGFALFSYCFFAKIRKYIGISKFIGGKVQIVETGSIYINKVVGCIDKCHFFSDNGRLLRNKAGLFPNKCHFLWKECHIVTLTASLSPCRHPCHPQN